MNAPATFPTTPPMPAVARILARFERDQLAWFIAVALDLIDTLDGDPDLEDNGDDEVSGDEQDTGWTEYHTRGRHKLASGMSEPFADHEDDEDDDPDHGLDEGEPNFVAVSDGSAGCPIADPDYGADDEGEPGTDAEIEQMTGDVPALPVYALDPNIFNGKRAFLGMNASPAFIGEPLPAA